MAKTIIKITPDCIEEVKYSDDVLKRKDAWVLGVPERWEHKRYMLSAITEAFFTDDMPINPMATYFWNNLRRTEPQLIKGDFYIIREKLHDDETNDDGWKLHDDETNDDGWMLDFTIQDLQYIMDKIKLMKATKPETESTNN